MTYPVPETHDVDRAFPTSKPFGELPSMEEVPRDYDKRKKWEKLFHLAFYSPRSVKWNRVGLCPREGVEAAKAWGALEVLLGVRDISHEHKTALWPWFASEWFLDCRWEESDGSKVRFEDEDFDRRWESTYGE